MFSIFPALLDFGFFGSFIIRMGLVIFILYIIKQILQNKITILDFLNSKGLSYNTSNFIFTFWILIYSIVGALIFIGLFTQIAFIVLAILMIELILVNKIFKITLVPSLVCLSFFLISLGAVFLGAGAFAFDLPL